MTKSKAKRKFDKRPNWDQYFLELAHLVSKRATCLRRKVGAVLVKDKRILATGYNGAPSGITHCEVTGCLREKLKIPSGERHELCLPPNEEVLTNEGYVPIHKIKLSQRVLTHKGLYRKVIKVFKRKYRGRIYYIEPWHLLPVALTPHHPVLAMRTRKCQFDARTLCKETCKSVNRAYCSRPYLNYELEWIPACRLNEKDIVLLPFDNRKHTIEEIDLSFIADAHSNYYRVLKERSNGKSYGEIKRRLNIWPSTAYNWTNGGVPRSSIAVYSGYLKHGSSPSKSIPYHPIIDMDRNNYRVIWKDKRRIPYGYIKGNIFFNPIRKIWIEEYSGFVYNLEVEGDHSYITKSFIVHNCRGLHAEQNVLLQAALYGVTTKDSILYITNQPCIICAKMIINAGIKEIVVKGDYPDKMAADFLKEAGIKVKIKNQK